MLQMQISYYLLGLFPPPPPKEFTVSGSIHTGLLFATYYSLP